jgi:hypothetical protein
MFNKAHAMHWMKDTLGKTGLIMWAIAQGVWLFLLYLFVGYIMVVSLTSLQLRDALEGTTYDEVRSVKNDYEIKENHIRQKRRRSIEASYAETDQLEANITDQWNILLNDAVAKDVVKNYSANGDQYEYFDKITSYCVTDTTNDNLCIQLNEYMLLIDEVNEAYDRIALNDANPGSSREVLDELDEIAKLKSKTPYTELFTTVEFMDDVGFSVFLTQPRELLVLQLTMVMGTLGSLVTMTWLFIRRDSGLGMRRTLFLPLVGSVSAFIIFVFFKAGQLTISSDSGTSSLSPFFLSFVGIISGLLSERAYARMESVGTKFFTVDDDHLRWGIRLREALDESGMSISQLAGYLGVEESTARGLVDETAPATQSQQALIAASLRKEIREIFTDEAPRHIVHGEQVPNNEDSPVT